MYTYIRMYTNVCIHIRIGSRAEEEAFILRMSAREHSIRSFLGCSTLQHILQHALQRALQHALQHTATTCNLAATHFL